MLDKELEKLADLEFEYNLAKMYSKDDVLIAVAKGKIKRQLEKIEELEAKKNDDGEKI